MSWPARIAKKPLKHGRTKVNDREQPWHQKWIRTLTCLGCGASPQKATIECAHVRNGTDGGTGLKPSDRFTVPLCSDCHREQHNVGEVTFWGDRHIDAVATASTLWSLRNKEDKTARAEAVIFGARQRADLNKQHAGD